MTKDEHRQLILEKRLAMSAQAIEELSQSIQERLLKSNFWPKTGRVGLYSPVKNEVMTQALFQKALESGLHVYFPRVEQGIQFYEVNGPEDLQRGSWSIPEPKMSCAPLAIDQNFDLLVVPGLVFTKDCYRLGYGRGFYDKYIANLSYKAKTIAMAYDFQIVDYFTIDEWDQPLMGVMTEKHFFTR